MIWWNDWLTYLPTLLMAPVQVLALRGGWSGPRGPLQLCYNLLVYIISRFALKLVSFRLVCVRWYSGWSTNHMPMALHLVLPRTGKSWHARATPWRTRVKKLLAAKREPGSDQQQRPWPQVILGWFLAFFFRLVCQQGMASLAFPKLELELLHPIENPAILVVCGWRINHVASPWPKMPNLDN